MFSARPAPGHANGNAGHMYRQIAVESQIGGAADPHRLVAMLFDGVIEAIAQARGAMRDGRVADKGRAISRAVRIVDEGLRASLDVRAGGTLAQDLGSLYAYICTRLTAANLKNDEKALDECAALIQPIAQAWAAINPATAANATPIA
jgi:flagellar protein FliS